MLLLHLKRVLFFGLLGLIGAAAWIWFSPKVYEARMALQVGDTSKRAPDPSIPDDVGRIIDKVQGQQPATEVDILRQDGLFANAAVKVADKDNVPDMKEDWKNYYKMYTVLGGPAAADANPLTISGLAVMQVRAYDAQVAIDLANQISQDYTNIRKDNLKKANIAAENYLSAQIVFYDNQLKQLDLEFKKAKEDAHLLDTQLSPKGIEDYATTLQSKRDQTVAELNGAVQELASLKRDFAKMSPSIPSSTDSTSSPALESLASQLATAKAELAYRQGTFIKGPEVEALQARVDTLQASYNAAVKEGLTPKQKIEGSSATYENMKGSVALTQAKVSSLRAQLADVDGQYAQQTAKVNGVPAGELKITEIDRKRRVAEAKFENMTLAHDIIQNSVETATSPDVIISSPSMQFVKDPVEPNIPRTILIGLLAGLAIGAIFTVARESAKPVLFSATQLEQATGLPVVATMPRLPGGDVQRVRTLLNSSRFPRKNFHDMASVVLAERESLPKTVVVCGVDGEAASSMAAVSYAAALARAGLRVTLVDANPSKVLTRVFGMEADNGIVDYLTQAALISQKALAQFSMLSKHNEQLGCRICAYGTADTTSLTDFSDDRVAGIIEALKPECDVLIIETAPSGRLPDAVRMARHADEVLATFESGTSSDRSVETLRDLFAEAGVKKMSMVLTSTLERVA